MLQYKKMMRHAICKLGFLCLLLVACPASSQQPKTLQISTPASFELATKPSFATMPIQYPLHGYAILAYSRSNTITNAWMDQRFEYKIGGDKPVSRSIQWMTYYDIYGPGSIQDLLRLKDWAYANRIVPENILLHSKINYSSTTNPAWFQMDKFDNFEGANGVLIETSPKKFSDKTSVAYQGRSPYFTMNNSLYIGYEEPFDRVVMLFKTTSVNLAGAWQYWNGQTWTNLHVTDGTLLMQRNGTLSFTPPSNWQKNSINRSRNKYFIRFHFVSASTNPVIISIKGDNWLNGAGNACRGWDATSPTIVNAGTLLAYNPTPPPLASARFPYQARITYWANNHFIAHPADIQNIGGSMKRTWAQFLAYEINRLIREKGVTGVMGDDGERSPVNERLKIANTDFSDKTSNSWHTESLAKYRELAVTLRSINRAAKLGLNGQTKSYVALGDLSLAEYQTSTWVSGGGTGLGGIPSDKNATTMTYDDYLPVNNPSGKIGLFIYADTVDVVPDKTTAWDRSNRGPIVALSKHYIGKNPNTIFSYYSKGGYIYSETDEVLLKNNSVVHLATQPIPVLALVKRWGTWFPAMGVDIGVPDVAGYNNGKRNFTWKSHTTIGGRQDVWRRDYTKAMVLHRPAMWNTTDSEYSTPSAPMALGASYYPLRADGTVGAAITSISLRTGEGAILIKASAVPR